MKLRTGFLVAAMLFWGNKSASFAQVYGMDGGLPVHNTWVDSVYAVLTPEERIAQLIWPMVEQIHDAKRIAATLDLVTKYRPGGILFMKNTATAIVEFNNRAQAASRIPMLTAIDGEWGVAMRVDGALAFPRAMTLGAVRDDSLVYRAGRNMAEQLKVMGLTVSFGPVADVNCNPANPIIGMRSFGENPVEVANRSVQLMRGLQDGGVMAVAKHFPGHGDTQTDSHLELPILTHSRERFDSLELVPFAALIKNGVYGVMSAHLEIPALEPNKGIPSSLSKAVVTDLLKGQMGFSGLVVTDAMNMKGVKKAGQPGRVDALALAAGNDVVESSENLPLAIEEIKKAIINNELTWDDIELKCRKVLAMKYVLGATTYTAVDNKDILTRVNSVVDQALVQQLYDESLTLLSKNLTDAAERGQDTITVLLMPHQQTWRDSLKNHLNATFVNVSAAMTASQLAYIEKVVDCKKRVLWVMDNQTVSKNIWNSPGLKKIRTQLQSSKTFYTIFAGSPYQMNRIAGVQDSPNLVLLYEDVPFSKSSAARFFAGKLGSNGQLPVGLPGRFKQGDGLVFKFGR